MRLIGFNFTKINIEKFSDKTESLNIDAKINVSEINSTKMEFFKINEELLTIKFTYLVDYAPDFAKIELKGNILLAIEAKMAKDILKQWKDKKISEEFRIVLFNLILKKSNVKALELEDEMNLPFHVPLPSLKKQEIKDKKESNSV